MLVWVVVIFVFGLLRNSSQLFFGLTTESDGKLPSQYGHGVSLRQFRVRHPYHRRHGIHKEGIHGQQSFGQRRRRQPRAMEVGYRIR